MSIFIAIVALALLIVVHEAGHFLVARLCGMRVERFSIGFGNPLVSFKRGDTIYQIAPIPLGGFVQITGLNPHEEFDAKDPYVYPNRPRWMRLAVLVAGPGANYLTAAVLAVLWFSVYGQPKKEHSNVIDQVMAGTPAEKAGLKAGDVLKQANSTALGPQVGISTVIGAAKGAPVTIQLLRGGQPVTVTLSPELHQKSGSYRIGIGLVQLRGPVPFDVAFKDGMLLPFTASGVMLESLWAMIRRKVEPDFTGPVGIVGMLAKTASQGGSAFLEIVIQLSTYLGLFNLLPLPALDGGRVLFLGLNSLRRTDLNVKTEANVHMVGLVALLLLLVVVTFKDIKEIVVKLVS
jgi:regulator of sigma E protease